MKKLINTKKKTYKMYTFDEVIEELGEGKTAADLKKQKISSQTFI